MQDDSLSNIAGIVEVAEQSIRASLRGIPAPLKKIFEPLIQRNLRLLTKELRVPNIALYGRAGSGKSSLINALMDAQLAPTGVAKPTTMSAHSYEYERQGWKLRFTDSRGVGDMPNEDAREQAIEYIIAEKVDILLFVVPADERGYVSEDVDFLDILKTTYKKRYSIDLPIILVLNKIDRIDPIEEWSPPYDLDVTSSVSLSIETPKQLKEVNIIECLRARIDDYKSLTSKYIPICVSWNRFTDRRYNVDNLAVAIYDNLPDFAKPGFAAVTTVSEVKKSIAMTITWSSAIAAGSTCFVPIPGVDIGVIVAILTTLVSLIARLGQGNQDKNRIATQFIENMGVYGGGLTLAVLAAQSKFIPVVGVPMAIPAAAGVAAIIVAVGQAAINHFIEGISIEDSKRLYEEQNQLLKSKFIEAFTGSPQEVARRLQDIGSDLGIHSKQELADT